jgi:hypothetical protein
MTGGSDGQSDRIKRTETAMKFSSKRLSEVNKYIFLSIFYTITVILIHIRTIHYFMYIPRVQKPNHYIPKTGQRPGVISTIVNTYTRSLFYLTNAVCHNPPAFQRRCVALHIAPMVYTTC